MKDIIVLALLSTLSTGLLAESHEAPGRSISSVSSINLNSGESTNINGTTVSCGGMGSRASMTYPSLPNYPRTPSNPAYSSGSAAQTRMASQAGASAAVERELSQLRTLIRIRASRGATFADAYPTVPGTAERLRQEGYTLDAKRQTISW